MAELYEIAFALESQRESIARAAAGAVHERQEQARQERRGRRERRKRHAIRQDKGLDALKLKHARQSSGASGAGWKPFAMKAAARKSLALSREAMDIAREWEATAAFRRIQAGTHDGPDRSWSRSSAGHREPSRLAATAGHAFWTWLLPAAGVAAGILAMLAVLLAACFLS